MLRRTREDDIPGWLRLAAQVESLFGAMVGVEGFEKGILACAKNGNSFCFEGPGGGIEGVIAFDREHNSIEWLSVDRASRGKGIGAQLIGRALEALDQSRDITVQTFAPGVGEGLAARRLYERFGFADRGPAGKNPAGIDTVIMARRPS